MLTTLRIKNLALVEDLTLDFAAGFTAVTGETGAGKSILVGALKLALGERADRNAIRAGADTCSIEAVFDTRSMRAFLKTFCDENGLEPCADDQLVLRRTISPGASGRQFINGSPTTLAILCALGEELVDFHGPHDHQSLLNRGKQLELLDAVGGLLPMREEFAALSQHRQELLAQQAALIVDERAYDQKLDLLRHQVEEIDAAKLQADEEPALEAEHRRMGNAARLLELAQSAQGMLDGEEASIMSLAGQLGRTMNELQKLDPTLGCTVSLHEQMVSSIRDLQSDLSHYADQLELDPQRFQQVEERLNLVQSLKRKYGSTLDDVLTFGETARLELKRLEGQAVELERIARELTNTDTKLLAAGQALSRKRRDLISKFSKSVAAELSVLGFKQAGFDVNMQSATTIEELKAGARSGLDSVEFQFAPNVGEPARPLAAIVSSGELSRVMLALKTVLAGVDRVPVMVFDEIDANVGGETASAVGGKMKAIGRKRQVLCITHLAPVAAMADTHYSVAKQVKKERTITAIQRLEGKDREAEIARMLGGQSAAAMRHAQELLG